VLRGRVVLGETFQEVLVLWVDKCGTCLLTQVKYSRFLESFRHSYYIFPDMQGYNCRIKVVNMKLFGDIYASFGFAVLTFTDRTLSLLSS
jgi:hypothetical protein